MDSRMTLREDIYLIGDINAKILGNKLPSKLQVLKVFLYHVRVLKSHLRDSAMATINEVKVFWQKAHLPTQRVDHCTDKLLKLHDAYRTLQKHRTRKSNRQREYDFVSSLKNLFDIAHANSLNVINENEKNFLINQRKDGIVGYIANIKEKYDEIEREESRLEEIYQQRVKRSEEEEQRIEDSIESASTDGSQQPLSHKTMPAYSDVMDEFFVSQTLEEEAGPSKPKRTRGSINIMNYKFLGYPGFINKQSTLEQEVFISGFLCDQLLQETNQGDPLLLGSCARV